MMEYNVNRIEFVKTQKTKYVAQKSEQIFQICIDCIVHNDIVLKDFFIMFLHFLCNVLSAPLLHVASRTLMCLLPNTL